MSEQRLADNGRFRFSYDLDAAGKVTKTRVTNPRGTVREVAFNADGYPISDTAALGDSLAQELTIERDAESNLVRSTTDQLARKTAFEYDAAGNVTKVTELEGTPGARSTRFTYEPTYSQLTSVTDALDRTTTYQRDPRGRLTSVRDATGREHTFGYTGSDGRPTSITTPLGKTSRMDYQAGDLVSMSDPLGRETRFHLDPIGRRVAVSDPLGNKTGFDYDDADQLTKITAPDGGETSFAHDLNGNLTRVTDARGNARSATYDSMDRVATQTDPSMAQDRYEYDLNGNLVGWTDRRGKVTSYRYDALDRRTFAGFGTTGSPEAPSYESTITYDFDGANRLTRASDSAAGSLTRSYDLLDRMTAETGPSGSVSYSYDGADRRVAMSAPGQPPTTYSYDQADRLTGVVRGSQNVTHSYDGAGRRQSTVLPNGVSQEYSYDDASQLTGITYRFSGATMGDLKYAYDDAGKRTAVWGSYARTNLPDPVASLNYDNSNRLIGRAGKPLEYDLAGNMTKDAETPRGAYTWNARGELMSISGGQTASFNYDAFGRRVAKTVGGKRTDYVHDGSQVIQERTGVGTANLLAGLEADELYARDDASGTASLLTDALGSVIALTDTFGWSSTTYTYDPFGNTTHSGASSDNAWQYTGRENDGTGLYHYRARYYHPGMQRFTSEDPIGLASGDTNLQAYVANAPLDHTDPTGLRALGGHANPSPMTTSGRKDDCDSGSGLMKVSEYAAGLLDGVFEGLPSEAFGATGWCSGAYQAGDVTSYLNPRKAASKAGGKALGFAKKKSRKKPDIKQVDDAALESGVPSDFRRDFGNYIEAEKHGGPDFSYRELRELADQFKRERGLE